MHTITIPTDTHRAVISPATVTRRYGDGETAVDALRGVSLEVARGELTAIMGPSGSGKSTLMHILAGLDQPTSGRVSVAGVEITDARRHRADEAAPRPHRVRLPVLQPAADAHRGGERRPPARSSPAASRTASGSTSCSTSIGLDDRRRHRPSELSGGQQQRVAVARALVSRPTVMFADEPTGNLDSHDRAARSSRCCAARSTDLGQTTVMVTHDAHAAAIADRVLFLADGHIVRDLGPSTAHEILDTLEQVTAR